MASLIKSFSIGNGDMFCIRHANGTLTLIDCDLPDDERRGKILAQLTALDGATGFNRFISTHPDDDHIGGLVELDDKLRIDNFYCVENNANKTDETDDFKRYKELRDGEKAFYLKKNVRRKFLNDGDAPNGRGSSGITVLWPDTSNSDYQVALTAAELGNSPNNISPILSYHTFSKATIMWMGDLETTFMEKIVDEVHLPKVHVLFAPHHGRDSGKVPAAWLEKLDPDVIVVGEAPSEHLSYYPGYNTITQNTAGDILIECDTGQINFYVGDNAYQVNFLKDDGLDVLDGLYYIGTLHH